MQSPNRATITAPFHHKPTHQETLWIPSLWDIFMIGLRAVPVRALVSHLLSLNESLRNKFLESHIRISYQLALTPTIESQGTPSSFS